MVDSSVARETRASGTPALGAPRPMDRLIVRGSVIEIVGYVLSQVLRLATNMILAHLLFPEAYGLTAIVTVFMVALSMLTDVGLRDSIISNERGDEVDFLNTAWTIQVIRGFGLWALATAMAWPVAWLYRQPELVPLIAVASVGMIIHGFGATKVHTLARKVYRGPLLVVEITSKLVSMVVMFVWAKLSPSVWALVAGGLTQTALEVAGGHFLPVGYNNRFRWDDSAARTIRSFG